MLKSLRTLLGPRSARKTSARRTIFEALELRHMPALVIDVGHHFVEPDTSGEEVEIPIVSTDANDPQIGSMALAAQIAAGGPVFEDVDFSTNLWNTFPHVENGGPASGDLRAATGGVTFIQQFEAVGDGQAVKLTVSSAGIPAGSFELRLSGTRHGGTELFRGDGTPVSAAIINGTIQVRSIWQNPKDVSDVDGDGFITPRDVLLVINRVNKRGPEQLPMPSIDDAPPPYYDVDGDGFTSANDALVIINCLNGGRCQSSPTEIAADPTPPSDPDDSAGTGGHSDGNPEPGDEKPPDPIEGTEPPPAEPPLPDPIDPEKENEKYDPPDPVERVFGNTPVEELVDLGLGLDIFSKS